MSDEAVIVLFIAIPVTAFIVGGLLADLSYRRKTLSRYRPTHDNRFPHRDEFRAFMRDVK